MRSITKNRGRDTRWQRESKRYLRMHPYCECDECMTLSPLLRPVATEVNHMDGLGPIGPRGFDWTNLQAVTRAHHARITGREQPGGWNDRNA